MKKTDSSAWDKRSNLLAALFFLGLITLFYHRVIFGNSIFVFVDASRFFYPLWKWGAGVLNQGIIPLWNPDAQFGTPFFADPQMAYAYPPVPVLYSFLNPLNAFAALIILHHLWALLGFWFFARGQGFSAKTSLLGSLTFGFSLHVVCSSWTPVALMTISWVPWIFFGVEKVFKKEKGGLLYLSLAWAMQFSAGYPVLTYLTALAVLMHLMWRTLQQSKDRAGWVRSRLGMVMTSGLIAVAYNLVWGLPFAEFFQLSNYENGAGRFHNLTWLDLTTALAPFVQGHPLGQNYHGPHYWVSTYFLGRPALCLLLWGMFLRTYRKTSWGIFLILLVLSLGSTLWLGTLLKALLPGYSLVVHSGFWISLLVLWAAWMAMESTEVFFGVKITPKQIYLWLGIVAVIYAISFLIKKPLTQTAFWLSFLFLGLAPFVKSIPGRWGLLLLALGLSLGTAADSLNILLDCSYYEDPPKILRQLTQPGRLFFSPPLMREAARLQGNNMPEAYDMAKQKLYPDWPLTFGKEEAPIYNTLQLKNSFDWTFQAFQYSLKNSRNVLDYLNVRYVFGRNRFSGFKKISGPESSVEVSENPVPMPKWFSVGKASAAEESVEDDFSRADGESINYGKECFISDRSKAGLYQPRRVSEGVRRPNRLTLDAEGKGKALLVSSETNYPGWRVWVNWPEPEGWGGMAWKESPVETINHSFRGVVLNEGETNIGFRYEPRTFRLGLFISLLVIGMWTCLLIQRMRP